ncbi:glycosyltransferase family 2 protein [Riemerella columbina]|uniref:glycosyltransferase family 2 protein n=1 Tax=Riemerella columbina TaxID=103810 RepID=UPI0026706BBD|nr:glycosyltransferase family 2 protein [Riemerella columbina]WKS96018.1 glycosyltransferase family 2 protein [Riemerella columbina]
MKKLSIIILNYNVTALLRSCLRSIQKYADGIDYEIIVADNHSTDTSWKALESEFPEVLFLGLEHNYGFSIANNKAVQRATGEYILLLNPDTELVQEGLSKVLEFAESQPNMGCLGARMYNAEGHFLPESKRSVPDFANAFEKLFLPFFVTKTSRKNYYRNDVDELEIAPVEVITGAFLLMKRALYNQVGGLDERYFMYGEDIDLCYTLLKKGYQNYYYGTYAILHHKGQSTVKDERYIQRFYGAMHLFLDKYYKDQPLKYFMLKQGLRLKTFIEYRKTKPAKST